MKLDALYAEERLRDEFAMAALTGLISSHRDYSNNYNVDVAAKAYAIADAMLEARKETE